MHLMHSYYHIIILLFPFHTSLCILSTPKALGQSQGSLPHLSLYHMYWAILSRMSSIFNKRMQILLWLESFPYFIVVLWTYTCLFRFQSDILLDIQWNWITLLSWCSGVLLFPFLVAARRIPDPITSVFLFSSITAS
jgi:hypothetical protein